MQRRERFVAQSLGGTLTKRVKESRVLLVGAGGIGCELLKNLVCCGFGTGIPALSGSDSSQPAVRPEQEREDKKTAEIVVIDLDTIDLSNLNRQFLFRKQHIKKAKAYVAKDTASQFNPSVNIDAHHASIFDEQYDVEFYEGFDVVFNALDNLAARRHVNRMCLAADVPLIESGTTGFQGQVQAIRKGVTECYDCHEKLPPKTYAICTIRSTPSQPIHCIVWAKSYLLPELFGTNEEDPSDVTVTEGDNAEEVAKLKEEAEALKKIRSLMGKSVFAQEVFNKVFHDDIERLRSMSEMWQSRKPPLSLRFESVCIDIDPIQQGQSIAGQDQQVWSLQDNLKVFCYAIDALSHRVQAGEKVIEFDKDDKETLDFVAAAANLRSHVFGIPQTSEWDIKRMAGNIIPAIATSNALTASLCVMQAFKIIKDQTPKPSALIHPTANAHAQSNNGSIDKKSGQLLGGAKMTFLSSRNTDRMINSENLVAPKANCPVCSPIYAKLYIKEDSSPTLQQLVDLLKERLNYVEFSVTANAGVIYDPELEDNLPKLLKELDIDGKGITFITIQDDSDEPKVDLVLSVKSKPLDGSDALVLLPDSIILPTKAKAKAVEQVEPPTKTDTNGKRKREAEEEGEGAPKKAKRDSGQPVYVVEDEGAILLD